MKSLKKVISMIPKPLMSMIVYIIIIFFQNGINLITTPIFSRLLTTEEYGITTAYNSWFNIFSIFVTLNLYSAVYNNALLDYENKKEKMTSSFLSLVILNTCVSLVLYLIFNKQINSFVELDNVLIFFMILNFITSAAWGFFIAQEKFDYKYLKPLILSAITFILNPIIGYIAIKLFPNQKAIAKVIGCGLPTLIINLYLVANIMKKGKCFYNRELWKYALSFNVPLIPHYLSGILLASSDRIMIQKMIGFSAAGIYGISYQLSLVIQGVFTGINSVLVPLTYKNLKNNNYSIIKKYSFFMVGLVAMVSILLSFFAPEIINILAPKEYLSSLWVIPPIILGLYFYFIASLFSNIEFYLKKNKFVPIATTCSAIINVILNWLFIPKYGFIVAGYTTLIGYFILALLHYFYLLKIKGKEINDFYNMRAIIIISIITIIITILTICVLYKNDLIRYLLLAIIFLYILLNIKRIKIHLKKLRKDLQ